MQAHGSACKLMKLHSGTFWNFLHAFWDILEHSECILNAFLKILEHSGTFWNILEHSGIFWNILDHSGRFWKILDVIEGCRKVDFQVDDGHTHGQTDRHTLGLVELRLRSQKQHC